MENRILVVYIATGDYNKMYNGFIKSLHHFCPSTKKDVVIFTDQPDDYGLQYVPKDGENYSSDCLVEIIQIESIWHQPWPIVALMKFNYIEYAYRVSSQFEDYTHIFYFNSNIEFLEDIPERLFLTDKAIAAENCGWDHLGHDPLKFTYGKPVDPKSLAHIPTNDYIYVQSSMMGGNASVYMQLVKECIRMTERDLAHNIIPCFHDESYWNKVVYDHQNLVKILNANYNSDKVHSAEWGHPNAKIVMRDSSNTQLKYKDIFHEKKKFKIYSHQFDLISENAGRGWGWGEECALECESKETAVELFKCNKAYDPSKMKQVIALEDSELSDFWETHVIVDDTMEDIMRKGLLIQFTDDE